MTLVVQGGKADNSGNVHVGDEILAVNGLKFDDEQQATEYVRVAKKELILKVKRKGNNSSSERDNRPRLQRQYTWSGRGNGNTSSSERGNRPRLQRQYTWSGRGGQDKRRMNIRLASELPNYYATALESPLEKDLYGKQTNLFTNNDNNKRSSKEYEKDIKYGVDSNTANAIIDYESDHQGQSTAKLNRRSLRLTRSTTDLSESSPGFGVQTIEDDTLRKRNSSSESDDRPRLQRQYTWSGRGKGNTSSSERGNRPRLQRQYTWSGRGSPSWKNYNTPPSPDKVQRVRIRSTNVTSPGHYKYSPECDEDNHKRSDSHSSTPGYSLNVQMPVALGMVEDLNRTWPSVASPDISRTDVRLSSHKSFSVSAARSQFEQMSRSRSAENEIERSRKSSSSSLAPKPPSRNSSFRSLTSRRTSSSSSSVFSESENTKPEQKEVSPNIGRHESFSEKSRNLAGDVVPLHRGSSSDDLDKPKPPVRFSHSKVLNSFRSSKKPAYLTTGPSFLHDRKNERLQGDSTGNVIHERSQSLPSSKIVAMHLTSKSWVADRGNKSLDLSSQDYSTPSLRLPRSSSFSRARVLETCSLKTVHRDGAKLRTFSASKLNSSGQNSRQSGTPVIQAMKTGEVSSENTNRVNTKLQSNSTPFLQQAMNNKRVETKTESVPVLKENSIMQRLLMESQGEPETRSKTAAIKQEITQRSNYTKSSTKQTVTAKTKNELSLQQQRPVDQSHSSETEAILKLKDRDVKTQDTSKSRKKNESKMAVDEVKEIKTDAENEKDVTECAAKVDLYLDKLLVKLDSHAVKRPLPPADVTKNTESPPLSDDEPFPDPPKEVLENEANVVENESQVEMDTKSSESTATAESPTSDLIISKNERNRERVTPPPEIAVKSEESEDVFESLPPPPVFVKDNNDNISESVVSETTDNRIQDKVKQSVELKYDSSKQLSPPGDASLKVMHSRENSASSLLEETLESAKIIASIYSVEGPTRSADGEDSISTASEMRRYSLAKRVIRKRPKVQLEAFSAKTTETTGEQDQSFSTPERNPLIESFSPADGHERGMVDETGNQSAGSLSSGDSRPGSDIMSPKIEALEEQKEILISSMKNKVELLKEQESEINEEMTQNDELGKRVANDVKIKTSTTEFSKFELFVSELNNIIGLLLSLTQRMHRYEVMLQDIDLAEDNGREKRDMLLKQIDRVKQQYEEACTIKEINDKRGVTVAKVVEENCSDEEFADFQYFVDMKTQLALTQAEIRDKIKLGEEKLNALSSAQIDWSSFDLSSS